MFAECAKMRPVVSFLYGFLGALIALGKISLAGKSSDEKESFSLT